MTEQTKALKSAIIVNPHSSSGKTARRWGLIRDEVKQRLGQAEEFVTAQRADATRFARAVSENGDFGRIIIVGGDGTINEVINGLFNLETDKPNNDKLEVGILSAGRGCDFIRSVGIPSGHRDAVGVLKNSTLRPIDVGVAVYKDEFGRPQKRYFINIATAGLAGVVAANVNKRSKSWMPPELVYFTGAAGAFLNFKAQQMKVIVDGKEFHDGKCLNVFVANGAYSGAGMCWAPDAKVDDGLFDVMVVEDMSKSKLVSLATKLYDGSFRSLPAVHSIKGKSISIESRDDVLLEMDGEQPGLCPFAASIIPHSINLLVPA